ncbi:hypothetical protein D1007_09334 [Hordeum vulgare]|nr:hypothetical protein D1007_09334 [Hordeum vulgare]
MGPAGGRRSPSPMGKAATGLDAQEHQGSSQPATEQADDCAATPSLVRASGSASRARPEMSHGRRALAMATELLHYRPARARHNDSFQRIEEFVAAAGDSVAFSCSFRVQLSLANDEEQDAQPHLRGVALTPSLGRKCIPPTDFANPGWAQEMKQAVRWSLGHTLMRARSRRCKFRATSVPRSKEIH